jgi:hypothetical protein
MTEAAHRRERIGCLRRGLIEHPFAAIFAAALLVRLTNIALLEGHDAFFAEADTIRYWALGGALSQRSSFWPALLSMADRMPLYPLLLGAIQSVFGDAPRLVALTQAVVDAATCVLIARLGTFVAPRVGIIAGVLAACSVTLVVVSSQILTETVFLFLYTLMLVTAAQFVLAPTPSLAYFSGLTGGLALAVRPVVGPLMVAATPVVFVVALARGRGFAAALAAMALFVVGFGAPIAPVLLRNAVWYDSWSLTTESGDHLAFWIVPLVKQRVDGTPYRVTLDRSEAQIQRRLADRGLSVASNPFQVAAVKSEIACSPPMARRGSKAPSSILPRRPCWSTRVSAPCQSRVSTARPAFRCGSGPTNTSSMTSASISSC